MTYSTGAGATEATSTNESDGLGVCSPASSGHRSQSKSPGEWRTTRDANKHCKHINLWPRPHSPTSQLVSDSFYPARWVYVSVPLLWSAHFLEWYSSFEKRRTAGGVKRRSRAKELITEIQEPNDSWRDLPFSTCAARERLCQKILEFIFL